MRPLPEPGRTIEEVAPLLASGVLSAVSVVEDCLAKIDEWEPKVHAWVVVDREGALRRARELDQDYKEKKSLGPLHGITVGIKDIIDVGGLPTSAGVKLWGGGKPAKRDADLVANLRKAGAIILGKTVTTPYAWIDPPPTRNSWNLDRTPGGSSSGSAVAVATGMCLGSFGTQTGGSIIRPAAFCGVVGFKPWRSSISTNGIVPFAPSLDIPGPFALTIEGLRRLYLASTWRSIDSPARSFHPEGPRPMIGRLRGIFQDRADPEMIRAIDEVIGVLEQAGAIVADLDLPEGFADIHRAHRIVMAAEAAVEHDARFTELPDDYPPRISELIEEGRPILATDYIKSRNLQATLGVRLMNFDSDSESARLAGRRYFDALLTPAAIGPAPEASTTGDPIFNSPWTFLHFPAISLPIGLSDDGLPLGIQLVGPSYDSQCLLDVAAWCEKVLRDRTPRD